MGGIRLVTRRRGAKHDFTCSSQSGFTDPCRWGDYAGVTPDPTSTDVVWGSNQINGPVGGGAAVQWQTRNFALAFAAVADLVHNATTATDGNDNAIKPGEQFNIAEQIKNIGGAGATGITGTLQSKTNGLSINAGQLGLSGHRCRRDGTNATPLTATMGLGGGVREDARDEPASQSSSQGQKFDAPVKALVRRAGSPADVQRHPARRCRGDPSTGTSEFNDRDRPGRVVKKVAVKIGDIDDTFDSDLEMTIKAPTGMRSAPLVFDRGGSGDTFINTVFTDSASTPIGNGNGPVHRQPQAVVAARRPAGPSR